MPRNDFHDVKLLLSIQWEWDKVVVSFRWECAGFCLNILALLVADPLTSFVPNRFRKVVLLGVYVEIVSS